MKDGIGAHREPVRNVQDESCMGIVLDSSVLVFAERQELTVSLRPDRIQKQHGVTEIVLSAIPVVELGPLCSRLYKMIDPELNQRIAVVTGGNSGIGSAIVRHLASQGVYCVVHYLAQASAIEGASVLHETPGAAAANQVVEEITSAGGRAIAVAADLSDPCAPAQLFDSAEREFGGVDILVNNAAHCETPDTIEQISAGTIDRHFQVNVRAATLLIHEFVERHRRRKADYGRVINITTDAARAFATQIAYGASKYALEGLTRSIAVEAGSLKITVNAIAPGPIQTGWITPALEAQVLPTIPLGCVGTPEDIADAVVFLASRQARWITGQVIQVAGGHAL